MPDPQREVEESVMQEKTHGGTKRQQRKTTTIKQKAPDAPSTTKSATGLLIDTVERLRKRHGLSFFLLQRKGEGGVQCIVLPDVVKVLDTVAVTKRGGGEDSTATTTASVHPLMENWSRRWTQPAGEQKQTSSHVMLHLPDVLLQLLDNMGVAGASEHFSLIGGLTPMTGEWSAYHPKREGAASTTPPLQPITSVFINAIDLMVEVTHHISHHARATCALRRERERGACSTVENDLTDGENPSKTPLPRFFLLSPYVPYDALHRVVNTRNTVIEKTPFYGGEACEILLVYVCSPPSRGASRIMGANRNPEVWGRTRFHQLQHMERRTTQPQDDDSDGLFFIASTVEDYLRLGTAFSWVYGWQLCYSSQGPPPRSLPWMKLLSPSALSAVIFNSQ